MASMAGVAKPQALTTSKCRAVGSASHHFTPTTLPHISAGFFLSTRNPHTGRSGLDAARPKTFLPAGVSKTGVYMKEVCQGCRRQGLRNPSGLGGKPGCPVAQGVDGKRAGVPGRGAPRKALRTDVIAPVSDQTLGEGNSRLVKENPLEGSASKGVLTGDGSSSVVETSPEEDSSNGSGVRESSVSGMASNAHVTNGSSTNGSLKSSSDAKSGATSSVENIINRGGVLPATKTGRTTPPERSQNPILDPSLPKRLWRKTLRSLSSLNLAIGTLLTIAGFSAIGSVIEQNKSYQFYINNYPEENPSFGFLTWKVLLDLELDHIYTSWWFLSLLAFLAACLMACTSTRQLPMAKVARRWRFLQSKSHFRDMDILETLPRAKAADLVSMLGTRGYQVFAKGPSVYAFKGLAGKLGPIGVHVGLILTMAGCAYSATAGFEGSSMTPQGQEFFIGDVLKPVGFLSRTPAAEQYRVHVNNFSIDYMPNGNVNQFYSDLSIVDLDDREVFHKVIKVNDPLRYSGVTMYQTDWNLASLQARVDGGAPFRLPMAILDNGEGKTGKLYGTFLRTGPAEEPRGASLVARDFLSVAIYGPDGAFVGVRRPGSNKPIKVDGREVVIEELIGATGMQLKYDPGVPFVYAGFGTLIVTVITSQVSHEQLWALEEGGALIVGARSTKSKGNLSSDLDYFFNALPEYLPSEKDGEPSGQLVGESSR